METNSTFGNAFSRGGFYLAGENYAEYDAPDLSSVEEFKGMEFFRLPEDVLQPAVFDNFLAGEAGSPPQPWVSFDYDKLFSFYETISPESAHELIKPKFQPTQSFDLSESTLALYAQADIENELFGLIFSKGDY